MPKNLTFFQRGTPIIICVDKQSLKKIGEDTLMEDRDVSYPPTFSQEDKEGKTVEYAPILCERGTVYVLKIAESGKKTN